MVTQSTGRLSKRKRWVRVLCLPGCALLGSLIGSFGGVIALLAISSSPTPTDKSIILSSGSASFISHRLAIGVIVLTYDATRPSDDWLLCDGSPLDKESYPELYALLRGAAKDGQVKLPDFRGMRFSSWPSATGWLNGTIAPTSVDPVFEISCWVRGR